ncbi:MAG TPA: ANTAR domain-containing protein, partial [Acidimicrobiales bacterium]|nr:ANTAR domain-containing protein [Acidimicrobiales bacterium]
RQENAFDHHTQDLVRPAVEYAAEAIATSPLYAYSLDMVEGLLESMETQALIDQATGVIAATEERTPEEALDRLRRLALASGDSMRTVASWVLEERPTGLTPSGDPERSRFRTGREE